MWDWRKRCRRGQKALEAGEDPVKALPELASVLNAVESRLIRR